MAASKTLWPHVGTMNQTSTSAEINCPLLLFRNVQNMKMIRSNKTGYYITMHLAVLFTNSIYVQVLSVTGSRWTFCVWNKRVFSVFSPGSSWLICWPLSKPLAALDRRHITNYPLDGTCGVYLYSLAFSLPKTHTSKHSRIVDGSKWI